MNTNSTPIKLIKSTLLGLNESFLNKEQINCINGFLTKRNPPLVKKKPIQRPSNKYNLHAMYYSF